MRLTGTKEGTTLENRVISSRNLQEGEYELTLRPGRLEEYIGQDELKQNLTIFIQASMARKEALDHVLLYGPPGLGKTTLAHIIANELGVSIRYASGPAIDRPGDLASILTNLNDHDVLFIDEIHRLSRSVEEILYAAMEDFALDLVLGKGPAARSVRLDLPHFTLIGATTRPGLLTSPLRDRFGVILHLDFYEARDLSHIIDRSAKVLGIPIDPDAANEIARRSRGTPRVANRLLKRIRDYAQVRASGQITHLIAIEALDLLNVDHFGLDQVDRRLLQSIAERYQGGPVGLETLSAVVGEESGTIEEVVEPYLLQQGFLQRTPRGRVLTLRAYEHLGIPRSPGLFEGDAPAQ